MKQQPTEIIEVELTPTEGAALREELKESGETAQDFMRAATQEYLDASRPVVLFSPRPGLLQNFRFLPAA